MQLVFTLNNKPKNSALPAKDTLES
jgi:hypothetical protein